MQDIFYMTSSDFFFSIIFLANVLHINTPCSLEYFAQARWDHLCFTCNRRWRARLSLE